MTEEQVGGTGDEVVLPRGRVLSYMSVIDSPTRVRKITARIVWILGWLCSLFGLGMLVLMAMSLLNHYYYGYGSFSIRDFIEDILHQITRGPEVLIVPLAIFYFLGGGLSHLLFARAIRRGGRSACWITYTIISPSLLGWLLMAALAGGFGVTIGFMDGQVLGGSVALLVMLVCGVMVLLLWDLLCFLSWIARNPIEEKPPVGFLPRKLATGRSDRG